MANYVKFFRGSRSTYDNLINKDSDTLYFISETDENSGSLYLGSKLISGEINTISELEDVLINENISDGSILVYDKDTSKWVNKSIIDAIGIMEPASQDSIGSIGLVPAPGLGQQNYFLRGDGQWVPISTAGGSSSQVFEVITQYIDGTLETHDQALLRVVGLATLSRGDIGIVKDLISNNNYQYSAYVYNGLEWIAMTGNYSADKIYFNNDFIFTKDIGTVKVPSSGSITIPAAGKNLKDFFSSIFAQEEHPTLPNTSATITSSNIGAKEVGSRVSIAYTFTTKADPYKYGPVNNVKWSNYTATFNGETLNTFSGTFSPVEVTDGINLTITGSVEQSAGAIPVTNLGNHYPSAQIQAKTWNNLVANGALTGYRAWFCGYKNGENALVDPTAITGQQIRDLGNSSNGQWKSSMNISQMKQMFFAAPAGRGYKPVVKDASTTAPQTVLGPITVYVPGANNYVSSTEAENGGMAYDVWYINNAEAASGNATVNITKK